MIIWIIIIRICYENPLKDTISYLDTHYYTAILKFMFDSPSNHSNTATPPLFKHFTENPSRPGALLDFFSFTASLTSSIVIALSFKSPYTGIRILPTTFIFAPLTSSTFSTCSKYCPPHFHLQHHSAIFNHSHPFSSHPCLVTLAWSPFLTLFISVQNIFSFPLK